MPHNLLLLAALAGADYTAIYVPAAATVIATALTSAGLVLAAVLPVWYVRRRDRRQRDETRAKITAIHEQTANSHETNLRDDVDAIMDKLNEMIRRQDLAAKNLRTVRSAQTRTANAVTALAKRLTDHIDSNK